jgi:hypothetical protein
MYNNNNNNNTFTSILRTKTSSLKKCANEKSGNLGKYFKAAPQITLRTLHRNLVMGLPKPKHAATLL